MKWLEQLRAAIGCVSRPGLYWQYHTSSHSDLDLPPLEEPLLFYEDRLPSRISFDNPPGDQVPFDALEAMRHIFYRFVVLKNTPAAC
jgi:hypothetical protein